MRSQNVDMRLVGLDGTEARPRSINTQPGGQTTTTTVRYELPAGQELRLVVHGWLISGPVEDVLFVINDVPLP